MNPGQVLGLTIWEGANTEAVIIDFLTSYR